MSESSLTNVPTEAGKSNKEPTHPLLGFTPTDFNSFEEWLEKWNGTTRLAERLGLLHSLIEGGWWAKRELVSLFLEVADGYDHESNFVVHKEYDAYNRIAKSRKSIAEKAFAVLCLRFFKEGKEYGNPSWWWMLEDEILFNKVLWFLGRSENQRGLRDCCFGSTDAGKHQHEVFRVFTRKFVRLGWEFRSMSERHWDSSANEPVKKRLVAARPQFIDILCALGELNWLDGKELDAASLKKLTQMALEESVSLPPEKVFESGSYRKPRSLEEAILGGSVAARIVFLHRICEKERKRIKALYEESRRQQQDVDRQRELAKLKQQREALERKAEELAKTAAGKR